MFWVQRGREIRMTEKSEYWSRWWNSRTSRRRLIGGGVSFGLGAAALGIVGCGDDDDDGGDTGGNGGGGAAASPTTGSGGSTAASSLPDHPLFKGLPGGKKGGKFVWAQADDPVGGDPHSHEEPGTQALTSPVHNCLFFPWEDTPGEQTIVGELVEKWEQPSDTEVVLTLRKGVKWQDVGPVNGRDFVAKDVEYNLKRMVETRPENRLRGMFEPISGIELPDDHTVKLKLAHPFAPLFINLGFTWAQMVAREVVEAGTIERTPIGTGPFLLDKWERGVRATYKRNPNYWKPGLPFFDELEMQILADRAVREAKYLAGEHDLGAVNVLGSKAEVISSQMSDIKGKVPSRFIEGKAAFSSKLHLYFNVATKPFDDERVRKAFAMAFNYDQMIAAFAAGRGLRTGEMSSGNAFWAAREADMPKFDVAQAKALLEQAGQSGLKTENWVSPQYSGTTLAPIMQGLLKQALGIDVAPKTLENAQWISDVYRAQKPYPLSSHGDWSFDDPDRTLREYYHSKGSAQHQNLNDATLDKMLDDQRRELDKTKRQELVRDIQKYMMDKAYTVPLFSIGFITAVPEYLNYPDIRGGNNNTYRIRDIISATGGPRAG